MWAVQLHRLGLDLIGLWPKTDEAKKSHGSNIRVGFVFVMVMLGSGVPLIWALMRVWGDMVLMVDNLRITLPLIVVSAKFIIMRSKRTGMCWSLFVIQNLILHFFTSLRFNRFLLIYYYNKLNYKINLKNNVQNFSLFCKLKTQFPILISFSNTLISLNLCILTILLIFYIFKFY